MDGCVTGLRRPSRHPFSVREARRLFGVATDGGTESSGQGTSGGATGGQPPARKAGDPPPDWSAAWKRVYREAYATCGEPKKDARDLGLPTSSEPQDIALEAAKQLWLARFRTPAYAGCLAEYLHSPEG
jgi:hypothetical protein